MRHTQNPNFFVALILAQCLYGILLVPLRGIGADSAGGLPEEQYYFRAGYGIMPVSWYHSNVNKLISPGLTNGAVYNFYYNDVFSKADYEILRNFRIDLVHYIGSHQIQLHSLLALVIRDKFFRIGNLNVPFLMYISFDRGINTGSYGFSPFYVNIRRQFTALKFSFRIGILGSLVPISIYDEIGKRADFSAEIIMFPYIEYGSRDTALRLELYGSYASSYRNGNRYHRLYPRFQLVYHLRRGI